MALSVEVRDSRKRRSLRLTRSPRPQAQAQGTSVPRRTRAIQRRSALAKFSRPWRSCTCDWLQPGSFVASQSSDGFAYMTCPPLPWDSVHLRIDGSVYIVGGIQKGPIWLFRSPYLAATRVLRFSIATANWSWMDVPSGALAGGGACARLGDEYFLIGRQSKWGSIQRSVGLEFRGQYMAARAGPTAC